MKTSPLFSNLAVLVAAISTSVLLYSTACTPSSEAPADSTSEPAPAAETVAGPVAAAGNVEPQFTLSADQTHNRFSRSIPPILTVPSGAIIETYTEEASDGQLTADSTVEAVGELDFDPIHPLTGPIAVEGAKPGDMLKVTLLEIELGDYGWVAISPGFGFLADEFPDAFLRTFRFEEGATEVAFNDSITLPLNPFPGVMGVAPDTDELLSTIPPRANGGNMDNKYMTVGTSIYFPVFVDGANFSIGDAHAAQGDGEVCGTAIEAPTRVVFEIELIQGGRQIAEPQYETDEYYAVTAFATTIDEAARKATRYMIDYLVTERGMDRTEAYVLCSLAGDLKISEAVDVPHMLVSMHMPKSIFKS
ncbi:MAG: acetamidase/formamidase family protein [Acidobacteriota bacterium]